MALVNVQHRIKRRLEARFVKRDKSPTRKDGLKLGKGVRTPVFFHAIKAQQPLIKRRVPGKLKRNLAGLNGLCKHHVGHAIVSELSIVRAHARPVRDNRRGVRDVQIAPVQVQAVHALGQARGDGHLPAKTRQVRLHGQLKLVVQRLSHIGQLAKRRVAHQRVVGLARRRGRRARRFGACRFGRIGDRRNIASAKRKCGKRHKQAGLSGCAGGKRHIVRIPGMVKTRWSIPTRRRRICHDMDRRCGASQGC